MEPGGDTRPVTSSQALSLSWPRFGEGQRSAFADVWRAFWVSRAFVWLVGISVALLAGETATQSPRLDPLFTTSPFESGFANLLVSPAARFDSAWYLEIATHGYDVSARAAFFPLYPGAIAALGALLGSPLVAGILISSLCSIAGLYLVHRLVSLDHGRAVARATVWIICLAPSAFTLSAVYTEGPFLLLCAGALYCARLGRWREAALLATLAAGTRSAGVLLVLPLIAVMLYGPRADRHAVESAGWRPRHRLGPEALWLGLVPLGLLAYAGYLGLVHSDPWAVFAAQSEWERTLAPLGGVVLGLWSALVGAWELMPALGSPEGTTIGGSAPVHAALRNLALFAFLALAAWLLVRVARQPNRADTVLCSASLALPLSLPALGQPLMSLPRFMLVIYPLSAALALWALERGVLRHVLAASALLLGLSTALFTGWASAP